MTCACASFDSTSADPPLDEALALLRRVVIGVLGQVAVRTGVGERLDHRRALDRLQVAAVRPSGAPRPRRSSVLSSLRHPKANDRKRESPPAVPSSLREFRTSCDPWRPPGMHTARSEAVVREDDASERRVQRLDRVRHEVAHVRHARRRRPRAGERRERRHLVDAARRAGSRSCPGSPSAFPRRC